MQMEWLWVWRRPEEDDDVAEYHVLGNFVDGEELQSEDDDD